MVNLFFKRIIFIKENTFISSGNTYCDVILNVDHLGFVIRQFFAHDPAPLIDSLENDVASGFTGWLLERRSFT